MTSLFAVKNLDASLGADLGSHMVGSTFGAAAAAHVGLTHGNIPEIEFDVISKGLLMAFLSVLGDGSTKIPLQTDAITLIK